MSNEERRPRILVVDDQMADETVEELSAELGDTVDLESEVSFELAETRLQQEDWDVVVLDVMRQATASASEDLGRGTRAFELVRQARFVPVVFYTARPGAVDADPTPPLVTIVGKDDHDELIEAVRQALGSGVQAVVRGIRDYVDGVIRDFLWNQVAPNGEEYANNPTENARLLTSRVARSLDTDTVPQLVQDLTHSALAGLGTPAEQVETAATYYVYPPVSDQLTSAAVLRGPRLPEPEPTPADDRETAPSSSGSAPAEEAWYVVLTVACDLAQSKTDRVLLAAAEPLDGRPEWTAHQESGSKSSKDKLERLVTNRGSARFHFLPAFREIPSLLIDFEHVHAVRLDIVETHYDHLASLDSPFAETLIARHAQFRGRIGAPDLAASMVESLVRRLGDAPA